MRPTVHVGQTVVIEYYKDWIAAIVTAVDEDTGRIIVMAFAPGGPGMNQSDLSYGFDSGNWHFPGERAA